MATTLEPLVSSAALHEATNALREYAGPVPSIHLGEALLRLSAEPELPEQIITACTPTMLGDERQLVAAMRRAGFALRMRTGSTVLGRSVEDAAPSLWQHVAELSEEGRAAMDALLRRAFDPFEALATWPLSCLFDDDEVAYIDARPRVTSAVEPASLGAMSDGTMDYTRYACAIVKFTRLCNLRCTYCHDWRAGPNNVMPFEVQVETISRLLGCPSHGTLDLVWHGGEPTLIRRRGFLRILMLQRVFRRPGQLVRNRVQTNATRLDAPWVHFFARYGFRVGTSLDGPPQTHNLTRKNVAGAGTFDAVKSGIEMLDEARLLEHVYIVVSDDVVAWGPDRLLQFLRDLRLKRVGVLPVRPDNAGTDGAAIDRRTYIGFLLALHEARKRRPRPHIRIRELDEAITAFKGGTPRHCELLGNCVGHYFTVDPNGDVAHCDKFVGDPRYILGNVVVDGFDEIRAKASTVVLADRNRSAVRELASTCSYAGYCRGWCPHERYIAERFDATYDGSCCGLRPLFEGLERMESA